MACAILHGNYIVNVEGSIKKSDVGLQITPRCSTDVQVGSSDVLPFGAHTDWMYCLLMHILI
jgi:hypothetical protein